MSKLVVWSLSVAWRCCVDDFSHQHLTEQVPPHAVSGVAHRHPHAMIPLAPSADQSQMKKFSVTLKPCEEKAAHDWRTLSRTVSCQRVPPRSFLDFTSSSVSCFATVTDFFQIPSQVNLFEVDFAQLLARRRLERVDRSDCDSSREVPTSRRVGVGS